MTAPSVGRLPGRTGTAPVVGALAVLAALALLFAFSPSLNPLDVLAGRLLEVPVPKVVGLTQDRALVELERAQLSGRVEFVYSATVDRNKVVSQRPAAATTLRKDSIATIKVSRGPAFFTLPDFTGVQERTVRSTLKKFDIVLAVERVNDEVAAPGAVISQSPGVGTVAIGGSTVSVRVSSGPIIRMVPEVTGLPVEGAAFQLGKAGFVLGELTLTDNPTVIAGGVIGTDPVSGTQLPRDTPVKLLVSAGPAPVALPKVTGQQQADATKTLSGLGLVVAEVTQTGVLADPLDGVVMGQNPVAGTMIRSGAVVTVTVRRAVKPPPTTVAAPIPPPTLPPTIPETTTIPVPETTAPAPAPAVAPGP